MCAPFRTALGNDGGWDVNRRHPARGGKTRCRQEGRAWRAGFGRGSISRGWVPKGEGRPGAGWDVGGKLSQAKINITAMHAVVAAGKRYGAILWVKPRDVARTAKALKGSCTSPFGAWTPRT